MAPFVSATDCQDLPTNILGRRPHRRRKQKNRHPGSILGEASTIGRNGEIIEGRSTSLREQQKGLTASNGILADATILAAIALWYILGVVSISTTKVLLLQGIPPLVLTVQQLLIGSTLLRGVLHFNKNSEDSIFGNSRINQTTISDKEEITDLEEGRPKKNQQWRTSEQSQIPNLPPSSNFSISLSATPFSKMTPSFLVAAGVCFSLGFLATNFGFNASSASFVETIKAAEPLTSAGLAVLFGLETLGTWEWSSLASIALGVICSTVGNRPPSTSTSGAISSFESLKSCGIVMSSNLCFSLRGLYQKWYLQTSTSKDPPPAQELQFCMQHVGVCLLVLPMIICHRLWLWNTACIVFQTSSDETLMHAYWLGVALLNGVAFTSYNLSSTWLLSRITMVHHAALNCVRRIFAIVMTSILFQIPMTIMGIVGVLISMAGFLSFSFFKAKKKAQGSTNSKVQEKRRQFRQRLKNTNSETKLATGSMKNVSPWSGSSNSSHSTIGESIRHNDGKGSEVQNNKNR